MSSSTGSWLWSVAETAGVVVGAAGAVPSVLTAGLSAIGFSSTGIVGGSMAAAWQASLGNVMAGSLFASLQSLGATGGIAAAGPVGVGAAAVVGGGYHLLKYYRG